MRRARCYRVLAISIRGHVGARGWRNRSYVASRSAGFPVNVNIVVIFIDEAASNVGSCSPLASATILVVGIGKLKGFGRSGIEIGERLCREATFLRRGYFVVAWSGSRWSGCRVLRGRLVIARGSGCKLGVIVSPRGRVVFVIPPPAGRSDRVVIRISRGGIPPINIQLVVIVMRVSSVLVESIPTISNERRAFRKLLRFFHRAGITSSERGRLRISRGHPLRSGRSRITSTFELQSLESSFIVPLGVRVSICHVVILSLFRGCIIILIDGGRILVRVLFLGTPCKLIELLLQVGRLTR